MAHIVFYEKPGCGGNAKQKAWLTAAGHTLEVRDLLHWAWTPERLLAFLAPLPVADWFNRAAPAVRDGLIQPEQLSAEQALAALLAQPLLIRRPLLSLEDGCCLVGFDETWQRGHLIGTPTAPAPAEGCAARVSPCGTAT
ncbi:ArsC/Spx/MgsR family protein [Uliginosibacterium sp. 31-12]|uniref:ArsC/Spx/MgsR family protein n=1 Tax=Uliginosibacterium sp. 31-12 TaxID=3062781 RepID=UPI0026E46848|nr:ArsC/Spx/MgsR family protein [Uliginosibacterium sp. 31-12]MDO6385435.1 ArsC/Spx/MgsR family protein [Uliginosibacterium sp. 31-12]